MLPDGWEWTDPLHLVQPWRAERTEGLGGVTVTVDASSRALAIEWACKIEAGAAAVSHPERASGWAFNRAEWPSVEGALRGKGFVP